MGATGSERKSTFLTLNVSGERALPVFSSVEAAEDFHTLRGLGPDGALRLSRCAAQTGFSRRWRSTDLVRRGVLRSEAYGAGRWTTKALLRRV